MVKPVIIKRNVKGSALTFSELDTNFQNLDDATINFTDGTNTLSMDLNDVTLIQGQENHNLRVTVSEDSNGGSRTITIDNELGNYTKEPMGFENRTDSILSFNAGTRTFSITPESNGFRFWVQGQQFIKTTTQSATIPNTSGLWYFYFDTTGTLQYGTSFQFGLHCPVAAVQWNASTSQYYFLGEERHGVSMDWSTHEYLNAVNGLQYTQGFAATNYTTTGDGSLDSHAQIDLTDGVVYQEDIKITVVHSNTPDYSSFQQDIAGPGRFPVTYHSGSTGEWVKDSATNFPVKQGSARITYNLNTAGTWSTPDVGANQYVAYWLVATSNLKDGPIVALMGQRTDSNIGNAKDNNIFNLLNLTNFPGAETRPLYRLIYQTGSYGNTVNARLVDIEDVRVDSIRSTLGSTALGLANISEDLNPQLGGNLDVNGYSIVSLSNGNITITPNGTGSIVLDGLNWPQTDGTANYVLSTNGSGQLSWRNSASYAAYNLGTVTGIVAPDVANGTVQYCTLSGDITVNGFTNPVAGQTLTLIITQPTSGSTYNLTTSMRLGYIVGGYGFNGSGYAAGKLLKQENSAIDMVYIVYDGRRYYARIENDFQSSYTWESLDSQTWDSWFGDIWDF